ncbi:hypothetical protein PSHT_09131, partial [Puccinia striiformis]
DLLPGPPPPPIKDQIKLVNCGIVFYQLDKLKRTGIVCCMLQSARTYLSTHLNYLVRPVSAGMIDLNPEGWVVAQRLKFNHNNLGGQQSAYQARYDQHLKASTLPLTIKVKKTTIIGQGSMRKAYLALVKTDGQNGVRVHDEYPGINLNHATDACMYEACGHLFCAFQVVISRSTSHVLDDGIRQKIKAF